jgi:photosystem II stability/assembly factor-like uncharacterized protein
MKHLVFTCILICMAWYGMSQFVAQPLNYPEPGYWPYYFSIVDPDHVWVGTANENGVPCPFSVKTTDGGESWTFDSIPVTGTPNCISVCGWDTNTCFFVFMEAGGPTIWKTTDGGASWSNIVTTQFAGSFINFYHAFSADTGIAMGDPRDGYFEIQFTYDGGATWTRVPASDIPIPLTGEMGLGDSYSVVGNSVWFTTNKSRLYRSNDRGLTWNVAEVFPGASLDLGVCFSTELKGAVWSTTQTNSTLVVTNDGGISWDTVSFPAGYMLINMSRVPGWEGGFIVTAYKNWMRVYFTPDMFNTLLVIEPGILSTGEVEFYDAETGWLSGGESGSYEIYKFNWVLNSGSLNTGLEPLTILPNPSAGQAVVKLPEGLDSKDAEIRITDMTGKVLVQCPAHNTNFYQLDATLLADGIYLVALYSGNTLLAREQWVVKH